MSTLLGVEATKVAASPLQLAEEGKFGGKVKVLYDKYTFLAELVAGDVIKIGPLLPQNATIIGYHIKGGAHGGSASINLGWAASADGVEAADAVGLASALPISSAVDSASPIATYGGAKAFWQKFSSPVQIQVASQVAGSTATGKDLEVKIFYVVD